MIVRNGSTLKDALTSAGFARSRVFEGERWLADAEQLYVLVRPGDAVYAHVLVDASEEKPLVRELGLSTELRDAQDLSLEDALQLSHHDDGVSIASVRYRAHDERGPVDALDSYLRSIGPAYPVERWSHLGEHQLLGGAADAKGSRLAPWLGRLPVKHRDLLGYKTPFWKRFTNVAGPELSYR